MCIACHEVEKQVTEAINFIVSCCEQRAEGRVPDSSALYWMEESVTSEASPTAGEKSDKAVDAAPDMQEEPSVKLESQQEALDASGMDIRFYLSSMAVFLSLAIRSWRSAGFC